MNQIQLDPALCSSAEGTKGGTTSITSTAWRGEEQGASPVSSLGDVTT